MKVSVGEMLLLLLVRTNQTAASGAAKVLNGVAGNESIMVMQHNDSLSRLGAAVLELIQGSIAKGHLSATL